MERIVISKKDLNQYPISLDEFNFAIGNRKWTKKYTEEDKQRITAIVNSIPKDKLKTKTAKVLTIETRNKIKNGIRLRGSFAITKAELEELGYTREEFNEVVKNSLQFTLDEKLVQYEIIDTINNRGGQMSGIKNDIFNTYTIKYTMHGDCCVRDFAFEKKNSNRKGQFINVIFRASDNWEKPIILKSSNFFDSEYENIFVEIATELLKEKMERLEYVRSLK